MAVPVFTRGLRSLTQHYRILAAKEASLAEETVGHGEEAIEEEEGRGTL
ncbi:hypothetical protein ACS4RR_024415 (plasmid) [Rhizobium sp. Z1P35]